MSKRETPPAVGGNSLIVIFAVLCLTVFAMLSLSTVQADRRPAEASMENTKKYYEADTQAETILAQLRRGIMADGVVKQGEVFFYRCEVSETQELQVEVKVSDSSYEIIRWQLVSTTDWKEEDELQLWNGSMK